MTAVRGMAEFLVSLGLLDVFLPFLIIYMFAYYSFKNTQVFGVIQDPDSPEGKQHKTKLNKIYSIIAFSIAFLFISSVERSFMLFKIVSLLTLSTVFAIFGLLVFNMTSHKYYEKIKSWKYFQLIPLCVTIIIFYFALDWYQVIPLNSIRDFMLSAAFPLMLLFAFGWMISHSFESKPTPKVIKPQTTKQATNEVLKDTLGPVAPNFKAQDKVYNDLAAPSIDPTQSPFFAYDPNMMDMGLLKESSMDEVDKILKDKKPSTQGSENIFGDSSGKYRKQN